MNKIKYYLEKAINTPNQSGKSVIVQEYEDALISFFNVGNAIAVNSGSAALQTALQSVGAAPGKKVIVCATAPLPTLIPISATGAQIVFADSRESSPDIEPKKLEGLLDSDVVAIVEVSLWGYLQDYTELISLLSRFNIPLIEDASHSHGSTIDGKYAGTLGSIGCFSTHQKKLLSTGEGGFILTNSTELTTSMKSFSRLGNLDGKTFGMNFKPSAFTAAIGLARLSDFETILMQRRKAKSILLHALSQHPFAELKHIGNPNGYNLVMDINHLPKNKIHKALLEAGVEIDVYKYGYKCGYKHPLFLNSEANCKNAEALIDRLIQLPTNIENSELLAQKILNALS